LQEALEIRPIKPGEEQAVHELVVRVFESEIAPLYSAEGICTFLDFIKPDNLKRLLSESMDILVADNDVEFAGMTAVRDRCHISLLFVASEFQSRGVARLLLHSAINLCRANNPDIDCITVNASPNSVSFYRHVGFTAVDHELVRNGIRYTPMFLDRSLFNTLGIQD
jgi:GNAT superfamily N-acetyltransferase